MPGNDDDHPRPTAFGVFSLTSLYHCSYFWLGDGHGIDDDDKDDDDDGNDDDHVNQEDEYDDDEGDGRQVQVLEGGVVEIRGFAWIGQDYSLLLRTPSTLPQKQ